MRNGIIMLMLVCSQVLVAQSEVLLKAGYQPKKEYTMVTTIKMDGMMDISGAQEMMDQLAASGMTFPIPMSMANDTEVTIKTMAREADGRVPATMTYDKVSASVTMMGVDQVIENPLAGTEIKGWYDEGGKFTVESAPGLGEQFSAEDIQNLMNQVQQSVEFPDRPLKVGESFTQTTPMNVPIASMGSLTMKIEAVYTVLKIGNRVAVLGVEMKVEMEAGMEVANAIATGTGKGECIYDIGAETITATDLALDYTISMDVQGMKMTLKMDTKTKQTVEIR